MESVSKNGICELSMGRRAGGVGREGEEPEGVGLERIEKVLGEQNQEEPGRGRGGERVGLPILV